MRVYNKNVLNHTKAIYLSLFTNPYLNVRKKFASRTKPSGSWSTFFMLKNGKIMG